MALVSDKESPDGGPHIALPATDLQVVARVPHGHIVEQETAGGFVLGPGDVSLQGVQFIIVHADHDFVGPSLVVMAMAAKW